MNQILDFNSIMVKEKYVDPNQDKNGRRPSWSELELNETQTEFSLSVMNSSQNSSSHADDEPEQAGGKDFEQSQRDDNPRH